jgi:general secretion pathway protein K
MKTRVAKLRHEERGLALLMVLVTIAMLTVAVVEFLYQNRVQLQMAANVRDRAKAYYLARSAVNFTRLILYFQGQADRMSGGTVKLYQLIPIESDLARAFSSGELGEAFGMREVALKDGKRGFGEFDGRFSASIEDEYAKINLNSLDSIASIASPAAAQILALIAAPRYQALWEAEDAEGQRNTPAEVVTFIHDWIDADNTADVFNAELIATDPFSQPVVFLPGTSDEDSRYDRLKPPYKSKNNPLVTVEELQLVRGIGDDFMDEFRSHFTVYSDPNLLLNLTSVNDPIMMLAVLCMQPENMALCTEQGLPQLLEIMALFFEFRNLMQWTTFSVPNNQAIAGFFGGQGANLSSYFLKNLAPFSDTFTIQAEGEVGDVRVTVRAVVKNTNAGQEIMYWRTL